MNMAKLEVILPPPVAPIEVPGGADWDAVEANLTKLPGDYRAFIQRYGTGCVDSFMWIFNPGSSNPNLNLQDQVRRQSEVLREINEGDMEAIIPIYPDPKGVLPFGITDNGDVLFWETGDEPDNWTVAVLEARSSPLLKFEMNMTSFLAGICDGSVICSAFPEDFPSAKPAFAKLTGNHD